MSKVHCGLPDPRGYAGGGVVDGRVIEGGKYPGKDDKHVSIDVVELEMGTMVEVKIVTPAGLTVITTVLLGPVQVCGIYGG